MEATTEKFTCGRRAESGMDREDSPFRFAGKNLDTWRDDGTCSYCGSLNQDELMRRIEAGTVSLGPTDKSYKLYVQNAGGEKFKQTYRNCPPDAKCAGPDACTHWVTRERDETKFYFQHLTPDQMKRFVDLYNERKMTIGYPGHFYRLPFFMR